MATEFADASFPSKNMNGLFRYAATAVSGISSIAAIAGGGAYYECTKSNGLVEYSLYKCESGQEQKYIGGKETPVRVGKEQRRNPAPALPRPEKPQVDLPRAGKEYALATYKCVGRAGDILYTDAKDYLAFEIYSCTQLELSAACAEARLLASKDPLAVVSNKLSCP